MDDGEAETVGGSGMASTAGRPAPPAHKGIQALPWNLLVRLLETVHEQHGRSLRLTLAELMMPSRNVLLPLRLVSRTFRRAVDEALEDFFLLAIRKDHRNEQYLSSVSLCLTTLSRWPNLTGLTLHFNWDSDYLQTALGIIAGNSSRLRHLELVDRWAGDEIEAVPDLPCLAMLSSLRELVHLEIRNSRVHAHWTEGLASISSLTHLMLRGNGLRVEDLPLGLKVLDVFFPSYGRDLPELHAHTLERPLTQLSLVDVKVRGTLSLPSTLEGLHVNNIEVDAFAEGLEFPKLETMQLKDVDFLPSIRKSTRLRLLRIEAVGGVSVFTDLSHVSLLQELAITNVAITILPSLQHLSLLQNMVLSSCQSLVAVPNLEGLSNLTVLYVSSCQSLVVVPNLEGLSHLRVLMISDLSSVRHLSGYSGLEALTSLKICKCPNLETSEVFSRLTNLQTLHLDNAGNLDNDLPDVSNLTRLRDLYLAAWPNAEALKGLERLVALVNLHLHSLPKMWFCSPYFMPPTSIKMLHIKSCPRASLIELPFLPSLTSLRIDTTCVSLSLPPGVVLSDVEDESKWDYCHCSGRL